MFGLGKSKAVVGLDIGSSAVKAVELKAVGKGYKVVAFAIESVPPDSIVDGAIIDGAAVADAIRRVFENKAFKTKEVAASLSGNAVIVKKINLPVMTEAELAESIYWEAEQYIPFDIQDVNLDYQILNAGTGAESEGTMDVLLVAAKKEKIADYTGVISQAGRLPVIVDVDAFALQNAYEVNYGLEPDAVVVLLNAGASAININIITGDQSVFTRDISMGGNSYTEAVQKELNLPFESAEQIKRGQPVEGVTFEQVQPVLHAMTENVLLEIQKTFDFFKATASSDRIDRDRGQRRRVAGRRVHRVAAGALQHRRRRVRSVQDDLVRTREAGGQRSGRAERHGGGGGGPRPQKDRRPMIRINLLAAEREKSKKKAVTLGTTGQKLTVGCSLILVLAVLFIGWRYWAIARDSNALDAEIAAAQEETTRLHSVILAGAAVRAAQGAAAAARGADRAAAQRADRAGPHARSDQPRPAADAVADRTEAEPAATS